VLGGAGESAVHDMAALIRGADAGQLGQTFRLVFLAACFGLVLALGPMHASGSACIDTDHAPVEGPAADPSRSRRGRMSQSL
jgi:hypothetical protein